MSWGGLLGLKKGAAGGRGRGPGSSWGSKNANFFLPSLEAPGYSSFLKDPAFGAAIDVDNSE